MVVFCALIFTCKSGSFCQTRQGTWHFSVCSFTVYHYFDYYSVRECTVYTISHLVSRTVVFDLKLSQEIAGSTIKDATVLHHSEQMFYIICQYCGCNSST